MRPSAAYESVFGLAERPFSLTPDPKYFFASRSHRAARQAVARGLAAGDGVVAVTGDLGVGKTVLCRTLLPELRDRRLVAAIANPLLTPAGLFRLLLEDFGALVPPDAGRNSVSRELRDLIVTFLEQAGKRGRAALVVIDEAQMLPDAVADQLVALERTSGASLQYLLFGQPTPGEPAARAAGPLGERATVRAALAPLGRDECAAYLEHRLRVAGAAEPALFAPPAIDAIAALSGGLPRLVNLLADRSLQEAALHRTRKVSPASVEAAAAALELLRGTPRRFRWFTRRVS